MSENNKGQAFSTAVDNGEAYEAPNVTGTPERNLLMAILERAILDFVGNDKSEAQQAEEWLFSDELSSSQLFSFNWLCEQLDLNPSKIAMAVKAMPKRGNYRVAPWYFQKQGYVEKRELLCA